jgi:hypothetical protein
MSSYSLQRVRTTRSNKKYNFVPKYRKPGRMGDINTTGAVVAYGIQEAVPGIPAEAGEPAVLFDFADAQYLVATYPSIFSGYGGVALGDFWPGGINADEANSLGLPDPSTIIGYAMVLQPGVVELTDQYFYNYTQNPTFTAAGAPKQAETTEYTITAAQQVIDPTQVFNIPGYGAVTPASNYNQSVITNAINTENAQQAQYNAIQAYTDKLIQIQDNNPGFFGSAAGFAMIAGAIIGLGALASAAGIGSGIAVDADVSAAQSAAEAGAAVANTTSGVVSFGNGVIYNPTLGANGAFYLPSNGVWTDAVTGQAITDASSAQAIAGATTGDALANGQAQIVNGQIITGSSDAITTGSSDTLSTVASTSTTTAQGVSVDATGSLVDGTTTAADGTTVVTNATEGTIEVTDTAGNVTTINAATGAFSSENAAGDSVYAVEADGSSTYTLSDGTVVNGLTDGGTTVIEPDGTTVAFNTDANGNLSDMTVEDSDGNVTTWQTNGTETYTDGATGVQTDLTNSPSITQKILQNAKSAASSAQSAISSVKSVAPLIAQAAALYKKYTGAQSALLAAQQAAALQAANAGSLLSTGINWPIILLLGAGGVFLTMRQ